MARKVTPQARSGPALLLRPRNEVRDQLLSRVALGEGLRENPVASSEQLEQLRSGFRAWDDFNKEFLRRAFTTEEYGAAYGGAGHIPVMVLRERSLAEKQRDQLFHLEAKLTYLRSLAGRLDLIDESAGAAAAPVAAPPMLKFAEQNSDAKVFVVHGRDEEAKAVVARFLEHCGLTPVILHESADRGRTIIEKFEQEAQVGFAVVLLTPDDVGGLRLGNTLEAQSSAPRARQNVVLELGYFLGRLTRARVCALMKGDVELPSDYSGVVYTPMAPDEGWKIKLARELKAAGYDIDLNVALG